MNPAKLSHSESDPAGYRSRQKQPQQQQQQSIPRPVFNSFITSDRLRESLVLPMSSNIRKGRRSMFKEEMGLSEDETAADEQQQRQRGHRQQTPAGASGSLGEARFEEITGLNGSSLSTTDYTETTSEDDAQLVTTRDGRAAGGRKRAATETTTPTWLSKVASASMRRRPRMKSAAGAPPPPSASLSPFRVSMVALLIALVLPAVRYNSGRQTMEGGSGLVDAGPIVGSPGRSGGVVLEEREDSPTDVCTRWAAQSALLNGTMYIYGGRSKTSGDQTTNTWNNDLITLDLTKSWPINSPALRGLPQPSGPPAVSLGYLWNDYHSLFVYGGEFSDSPAESPAPNSIWQYDVVSSSWTEHSDPQTSAGNFSDPAGQPVQRAAEGAGVSVPELGVSWYFGGHLDEYTTPGWSAQVGRVYLKSLLEFTHPGYANPAVDGLHSSGAPQGSGAYRNVTWAGAQNQDGFTERADGVLVYVPGWGAQGVLLGLGGGVVGDHETTDSFASMETIDVYDIEQSTWYHQETGGSERPQVRVNPCAVVFAAPDASSFNVYMYGGQNLLPYGKQTQYTDIWILTVPSFTWIKVDAGAEDGQKEPPARAGHSCAARDGQMVVVGGYVGEDLVCDKPGVYSFDASALAWRGFFTSASDSDDGDSGRSADADADNSVLAGSFGYRVPDPVQSVVGGSAEGGATATTPAVGPATGGPFATGSAPVFTVSSTATPIAGAGGAGGGDGSAAPGTVAAGVIAGLAGLAAFYLGFCAWLYRRQVGAYRRHMAVANRYSGQVGAVGGSDQGNNSSSEKGGLMAQGGIGAGASCPVAATGGAVRDKLKKHRPGSSSGGSAGEQYGWVGQPQVTHQLGEPRWMGGGDDVSPGGSGGTGSGSGAGAGGYGAGAGLPRPSEDRSPWGYDSYLSGAAGAGFGGGVGRNKSGATRSTASGDSTEALLDGREPSFFNVVMKPRQALRVVNAAES